MLLRSLTKHVNDQNWFAVALDFFIVVLGILLAFQITNWNEGRVERSQEIEYLSAMERDINYSINALNDSIANLNSQQKARQALYEFYLDETATVPAKEMDRLVSRGVFNLERANVRQVTFETLKSSGQLSLIRSADLFSALEELSAELERAAEDKNEDYQITYTFSDPMLVGDGDIENIVINDLGSWHDKVSWIKPLSDAGYSVELIRTQRFKNIVLYKAAFGQIRIEGLQGILDRHHQILLLIDARQSKLGVTS